MPDSYIRGADVLVDERIAYAAANGLSARVGDTYRLPGSLWRKVWHTTEVVPGTLANCRALAIRHRTPPHLWASFEHDWVGQTVPLNRSAYALAHLSGDPETNHRHAIQTEVFGFAADGFSAEKCDWLGRRVLRPVLDAGIPINLRVWAPSTGSDGYGTNGKVRFSWGWWEGFAGQCGHANVPGNVHWDPGIADYARIASAAAPTPPPTPVEDDDMPYILGHPNGAGYLVDGGTVTYIDGNTAGRYQDAEIVTKTVALAEAGTADQIVTNGNVGARLAAIEAQLEQILAAIKPPADG